MFGRNSTRGAALLGAGALFFSIGSPVAGAQNEGTLDSASLANGLGGSAASVGSGELGSTIAGGRCVALDPTLPFLSTTVDLEVTSVADEAGEAGFSVESSGGLSSSADLLVQWKNIDTNATGEVVFGGVGVGGLFPDIDSYKQASTGAGTIEWTLSGHHNSALISGDTPWASLGNIAPEIPGSTAAYSACSGNAEID